ncbi:pyrroline-5-carboxylate reductase [Vibrio sp. WJH972]
MEQRKIAFIGSGNMAEAIISGLLSSGYPAENVIAADPTPERLEYLAQQFSVQTSHDNHTAAADADVIVLSVKPQLMATVCEPLQNIDWTNKLVISIAAGVSCQRIEELLGSKLSLVRVMPNTPALVNKGMSGLYANTLASTSDRAFAEQFLQSVGEVCWVEQESGINTVTAGSGSGPAYFFLFMEAMQAEAIAQGFDKEAARVMVQQTALGAAEMVISNQDLDIATLRERVTSKGGTTAEAIRTFKEHDLEAIVSKAMQAAVSRAEEMETLF